MPSSGSLLAFALATAAVLAPSGRAAAQDPMTPTNASALAKDDFIIDVGTINDRGTFVPFNSTEALTFFSNTSCCRSTPVGVRVRLTPAGRQKAVAGNTRADLQLVLGSGCLCSTTQSSTCCQPPNYGQPNCITTCRKVGGVGRLTDLINNNEFIVTTSAREFFRAFGGQEKPLAEICSNDSQQTISLWVDTQDDANQDPDVTDLGTTVTLDGQGPPAPTNVQLRPGNEAIEVTWTGVPQGEQREFAGYQVLCSRGGEHHVFKEGTYRASYTPRDTCAEESTTTPLTTDPLWTLAQTMTGPPPAALANLETKYLCSNLIGGGSSWRIKGLQNGIPYVVGVVSVDKTGNASRLTEVGLAIPKETRDFYTGYRADGGAAEGGFCSLARRREPVGLAAMVGVGLALGGLALVRRRRAPRRGGRP